MIKKIHYCWFGSAKPRQVKNNIAKWQKLNPDFEFFEWNDTNVDVTSYEFGRRALENKRWGFLVDIVRPLKIFEEGGFYIDADVEIIRPLRELESDSDYLTLGYMYDLAVGTAVIYSPQGHPVIGGILNDYHHMRPDAWPVSNTVFTDYFINHLDGFLLNGRRWKSEKDKISLYPKEFFEQPAFLRQRGFCIHHSSGSWFKGGQPEDFNTGGPTYSHKLKWLKRKIRTFLSMLHNEYRAIHLRALCGLPTQRKSFWRIYDQD